MLGQTARPFLEPTDVDRVESGSSSRERSAAVAWAAAGVLLVAALLRFELVPANLPFLYDFDEIDFVTLGWRVASTGDPNPHWFGHPGTVTIYLLSLADALHAGIGVLLGWYPSAHEVAQQYRSEPSAFYAIGRATIVLFGLGSVALVYAIVRSFAGAWSALLAALLLALMPLHVRYSALIRTDIQQGFFLLAACWWSLRLAASGARRDAAWAGAMVGLAVATKYPSVLGAWMPLAACLLHAQRQRLGLRPAVATAAVVAGSALAACFVASPFLFLDFGQVLKDVAREARSTHLSATSAGFLASLHDYAVVHIGGTLGVPGVVLAAVGCAWLCRHRPQAAWVALGFAAAYLVFISSLKLFWPRWIVLLLPFAAMAAALGTAAAARWVMARDAGHRLAPLIVGVPLVVYVGWMAERAAEAVKEVRATPPATLARDWAKRNIPAGSTVLVERYGAQFDEADYRLLEVLPDGQVGQRPVRSKLRVPNGIIGFARDLRDIDAMKVDYIVLGTDARRFAAERTAYPEVVARYEALLSRHPTVFEAQASGPMMGERGVRILRVRR